MAEKSQDDSSGSLPGTSFSTAEFQAKFIATIKSAKDLLDDPAAKKNPKLRQFLNLQANNSLSILQRINSRNPLCKGFNPKNSDDDKFANLNETNDSIIDEVIKFMERSRNIKEGKTDLIEVHAKVSDKFSRIELRDFKGNNSQKSSPSQAAFQSLKRKSAGNDSSFPQKRSFTFLASSNVPRPQTVYRWMKVDNTYSTPFIPKLTRKPHATHLSLEKSITPVAYANPGNPSNTRESAEKSVISHGPSHYYPHPYQKEIEHFEVTGDFLEDVAMDTDEPPPAIVDLKPIILVQTKEQLYGLVDVLKKYKEIAVDVEHHNFRTYQGITCLLQISTADEDYILDVFPLWTEMEILNEIFANPDILKVFHGADYDIIWLQRDLGVYVVNMFDTGIAAKMLNYSHISLSYLVSKFADFQLDKRFQLADWRIRPLPQEMVNYARFDTHFLLFIYRMMKAELVEKSDASANLLRVVMDKSRELCLKRYEKKILEANDHLTLLWKNNLKFNARQAAALKALFVWRDYMARNEDESTGYVLPNNLLLKICEILPREHQGILACCNPIPPLVRQCINEIHKILLDARSKPIDETAVDVHSGSAIKSRPRVDRSVDLSADRRIDDQHGAKQAAEEAHIIPLLSWSTERGSFELNSRAGEAGVTSELLEVDRRAAEKKEARSIKSTGGQFSISDMFIDNVGEFIRKDSETRRKKVGVATLFEDYISPFQQYMAVVKMKKDALAVNAK